MSPSRHTQPKWIERAASHTLSIDGAGDMERLDSNDRLDHTMVQVIVNQLESDSDNEVTFIRGGLGSLCVTMLSKCDNVKLYDTV